MVQALADAKPDAIFNVLFGADLSKFVREGNTRGLFKDREVVSVLTGEPEYLDPLKDEAPNGWIVTGYPWYGIQTPEHKAFFLAYHGKFKDYPRLGSVVGYSMIKSAAAGIAKAKSTDTDKLVAAFKGLQVDTPFGKITYRAEDHQSTMGAFVGRTKNEGGKGVMVDYVYLDGAESIQPSAADVKKPRAGRLSRSRLRTRRPAHEPDRSGFVVQLLNGLASASSLFLVAAGLSLIFGVTRIVNFAHGSFFMVGIYVAYTLVERLGGARGLLAGAAAGGAWRSACWAR